ncbi:hypothetical protein ACMFMG_009825 [Clarireedia jacksonii]
MHDERPSKLTSDDRSMMGKLKARRMFFSVASIIPSSVALGYAPKRRYMKPSGILFTPQLTAILLARVWPLSETRALGYTIRNPRVDHRRFEAANKGL